MAELSPIEPGFSTTEMRELIASKRRAAPYLES